MEEMEKVIDQWVEQGQEVVLIGFSGGANMAVQLAARLPNVVGLITVAGNLDAGSFSRYHRLPPEVYGNNAVLLEALAQLPQLHYTGGQDRIIPPELTVLQLAPVLGHQHCVEVVEQALADHHGPWSMEWPRFERLEASCRAEK